MGAKRAEYQIVGRYMDGKEVTGYHLHCIDSGKAGRYSREQVAYLVGRDQVTNCSGRLYQDKVLLEGVGMSLNDLPVQQEDGSLSRTNNIGRVRRGTSASDAMVQWMIVAIVKKGKSNIAYILQNAGGGKTRADREQVLQLARAGRIGNARAQMYKGELILKAVEGYNLSDLPTIKE